jgi:hypothetical protein
MPEFGPPPVSGNEQLQPPTSLGIPAVNLSEQPEAVKEEQKKTKKEKSTLVKPKETGKKIGKWAAIGSGIAVAGGVIGWGISRLKFDHKVQEKIEETGIDPNQEPIEAQRKIATDQTNQFDFNQFGRIGLKQSDIDLSQISNPEIISPVFLRMSAEFGDDWLLPPAINENGQVTGPISEASFNDWVNALQLDPAAAAEFKINYPIYRENQQLFSQFLLNHGASQRLVDFLSKAEELKIQDTDVNTWQGTVETPDRYELLEQWLNQHSSIEGGMIGRSIPVEKREQEESTWEWVEPIYDMAENVGIHPEDVLGKMASLRAEWQHDPNAISRELKVVEMAVQVMPDKKMALYSNFSATNADWIMSCLMVGLMAVGLNRNPAAILVNKMGEPIGAMKEHSTALTNKLREIGETIMIELREKSGEFSNWVEEQRQEKNSRQLVSRLRNGLSLSRQFVFDLGGILNNANNQDLRDLVLTEGPNWFRHFPETHPEMPQILRFFGCTNYQELQSLANQPERIVNQLYKTLIGRGKKADLRKTEQVKELIALYRKASGFNEVSRQ